MDEPLLWLGTLACAGCAALGLLPLDRRWRLAGIGAALLLAPALVAADNWDGPRIAELREDPILIAAALAAAAVALFLLAALLRRRPSLLAPLLVATLPFRIPIDVGAGEDANLLLPLYLVIGAGVLAAALDGPAKERRARSEDVRGGGLLRLTGPVLAVVLVLYAVQAAYTDDLSTAVENVAFFLAPFAALFLLLEGVAWDRGTIRTIVIVLAAEGLVFAAVAAGQFVSGELFWNDKVMSGNEAHPYFRVNSLFWDPNILGRYLAVTMTALAALVAFGRRPAELWAASATFGALLLCLIGTFSQTSTIALIAGVLVLVATRWGLAAGIAAGVAAVAALAVSLALIDAGGLSSESVGRSGLVDGGLEIGADAPIAGTGSGGFADEFGDRFGRAEGVALESHTEPVTILAEQGGIGLLPYAALLAVTIGGLLAATGLRFRGRARGQPLACALLATYAVMVVHSMGYAAFLTDPITWAILAISIGALQGRVGEGSVGAPPEPAKPAPIEPSLTRPPA